MSVIKSAPNVLRAAFNRDELDSRAEAQPPQIVQTLRGNAAMPIDPLSDGTWIAANDQGVIFGLLNVNLRPGSPVGRTSRGRIIPRLLDAASAQEALAAALIMDHAEFSPFRLVIVDRESIAELCFDGVDSKATSAPMVAPAVFSSSGLGDSLVQLPRQRLFDRILGAIGSPERAQDAFHRHCWPDLPHLSVNMIRPGARTVSHTIIEVNGERLAMFYKAARDVSRHLARLYIQKREAVEV